MSAEVTRATGIEQSMSAALAQETSRARAAETQVSSYELEKTIMKAELNAIYEAMQKGGAREAILLLIGKKDENGSTAVAAGGGVGVVGLAQAEGAAAAGAKHLVGFLAELDGIVALRTANLGRRG